MVLWVPWCRDSSWRNPISEVKRPGLVEKERWLTHWENYQGEEFLTWSKDLRGNNDLLTLTLPDAIYGIHRQYLEAGADMIETNTFSSTSIAQLDYALEDYAYRLNKEGAALAKRACEDVSATRKKKLVWFLLTDSFPVSN